MLQEVFMLLEMLTKTFLKRRQASCFDKNGVFFFIRQLKFKETFLTIHIFLFESHSINGTYLTNK